MTKEEDGDGRVKIGDTQRGEEGLTRITRLSVKSSLKLQTQKSQQVDVTFVCSIWMGMGWERADSLLTLENKSEITSNLSGIYMVYCVA